MISHQRYAEAIAFCKSAVAGAEFADRAMLLSRWDIALTAAGGSSREGLTLERAAVKIQPDLWTAHYNSQNDLMTLGDEEGAWKAGEDLPAGYYSWGVALAKHGDLEGAAAKLKFANQKGPHWADPIKPWGDVLVRLGKTKEALAKYEEALQYAPNRKQLKEARQALEKQKS